MTLHSRHMIASFAHSDNLPGTQSEEGQLTTWTAADSARPIVSCVGYALARSG
jgi:hypothetical protein